MDEISPPSVNGEPQTPLRPPVVDVPQDGIRSGSAPVPEEGRTWVNESEESRREEEAYFISPLAHIHGSIRWTTGCVVLPGARVTVHTSSPSSSVCTASQADIAPVIVFGPYTLIEEFAAIDIYCSLSLSSSSSLVLCGGYNRFKSYSHVVLVKADRNDQMEEEEEERTTHARIGVEIIGTGNVFGPHATVDLRGPCQEEEEEEGHDRHPPLPRASSSMDAAPPSRACSSGDGRDLVASSHGDKTKAEEEVEGEDGQTCGWWPLRIGDFCQFAPHVHVAAPSGLPPATPSACRERISSPWCTWRWWQYPTPPPRRASGKAKRNVVIHRAAFLCGSPSVRAEWDDPTTPRMAWEVDAPVVWVVPTGGVRSLAEVHALSPSSSSSTSATGGGVHAETATATASGAARMSRMTSPDGSAIRKEEERYQLEVEQMCRIYIEMYGGTQPQEFDSLG